MFRVFRKPSISSENGILEGGMGIFGGDLFFSSFFLSATMRFVLENGIFSGNLAFEQKWQLLFFFEWKTGVFH